MDRADVDDFDVQHVSDEHEEGEEEREGEVEVAAFVSGSGGLQGGYSGSGYRGSGGVGGPGSHRSFEERAAAKDAMMQNLRDSSQQDRRVYVGNLSYDVKWHHLKDFMRQAGEVLFADVLLLPNGMSKVGSTTNDAGFWFISFVGFLKDEVIDGAGHGRPRDL